MSYIRSRKHGSSVRLAVPAIAAIATTLSVPVTTLAQSTTAQTQSGTPATGTQGTRPAGRELPPVSVEAKPDNPYKADNSASPKLTQPLVDTPKTIQVIKKELLQQQGAVTLTEALRNTPGITLQLGENGNTSAGDTFQLRGFAAQSVIFVDGIRDLGAVTRDVFNIEQIEVVKGPAGADVGRAAASGYLNLFTKLPTLDGISEATATIGTASRQRLTADVSRRLGENSAFRINVMGQDSGVDGRDRVENKGFGIAPSIAFGLNTPTRIYLYSQHLRQDNVPDGGIPTIGMDGFFNATPALQAGARVRRENFYGGANDYEKVSADMFTAKVEHDLSPRTRVQNLTRYGKSSMDRVLTGVNTLAAPTPGNPATWTVSRSRQRVDQTNEILANQTNLITEFETAGLKHNLTAGIELLYERQLTLGTGTAAQTIRGVTFPAVVQTAANLYSPNPNDPLGVPYLTGADSDGKTVTTALYAFDTLTINEAFKVNAGVRVDRYNASANVGTLVTADNLAANPGYAVGGIAPSNLSVSDNLVSWNLGAVYKPTPNSSIYAAAANSYTPPGGANFALVATANNQNNTATDPQRTSTIELGTKWDVLDRRLNLSAAVYRTENSNQVSQDPIDRTFRQFGKTRVQGLELLAVGQITPNWYVSGGIAKMKAEQLDQIAVNATSGAITDTTGVRWSPDLTASLWTTYKMGPMTLGGGVRYVSDQKRVITAGTVLATQNMPEIPSYVVADLMAAYQLTKNFSLRLNVYNLFDKEYISALNNGGSRVLLGVPRSAALTAVLKF